MRWLIRRGISEGGEDEREKGVLGDINDEIRERGKHAHLRTVSRTPRRVKKTRKGTYADEVKNLVIDWYFPDWSHPKDEEEGGPCCEECEDGGAYANGDAVDGMGLGEDGAEGHGCGIVGARKAIVWYTAGYRHVIT